MYPQFDRSYRKITLRLRSSNADFLNHHPYRGVSSDVFDQFTYRFDKYKIAKKRIEMLLPLDHPDLLSIIKLAEELELNFEFSRASQFQLEIVDYTKYLQEDIYGGQFVECHLYNPVFDSFIDINEQGALAIASEIRKSGSIEFGSFRNIPSLIFVRGKAKKTLESANLKGIELRSIPLENGNLSWATDIEPIFLLWSSCNLPVSNILVFNDNGDIKYSTEIDWNQNKEKWYPYDKAEMRPILKFSGDLPDVDIAVTQECFAGGGELYKRIIYSQKARSVLEEIGMELECVPVRAV